AVQRFGNRRAVAAAGYAIQACGAAVLWTADGGQAGLMVLGVMLVGSGIGNATSIPPLIAQTDFAPQDVTRVVALIVAMAQGTYAFAPACFGFVQVAAWAQPQGEAMFFAVAIAVQLLAAAVFLAYRPSVRRQPQEGQYACRPALPQEPDGGRCRTHKVSDT
ncbi:hypothetical protein LPZ50_09485, partial [Bordetella petrii]|nr:hypothetical protein [Bordetella petrii]